MSDFIPENYQKAQFYLSGSNVQFVNHFVCKRCSAVVFSTYLHDRWHNEQGRKT